MSEMDTTLCRTTLDGPTGRYASQRVQHRGHTYLRPCSTTPVAASDTILKHGVFGSDSQAWLLNQLCVSAPGKSSAGSNDDTQLFTSFRLTQGLLLSNSPAASKKGPEGAVALKPGELSSEGAASTTIPLVSGDVHCCQDHFSAEKFESLVNDPNTSPLLKKLITISKPQDLHFVEGAGDGGSRKGDMEGKVRVVLRGSPTSFPQRLGWEVVLSSRPLKDALLTSARQSNSFRDIIGGSPSGGAKSISSNETFEPFRIPLPSYTLIEDRPTTLLLRPSSQLDVSISQRIAGPINMDNALARRSVREVSVSCGFTNLETIQKAIEDLSDDWTTLFHEQLHRKVNIADPSFGAMMLQTYSPGTAAPAALATRDVVLSTARLPKVAAGGISLLTATTLTPSTFAADNRLLLQSTEYIDLCVETLVNPSAIDIPAEVCKYGGGVGFIHSHVFRITQHEVQEFHTFEMVPLTPKLPTRSVGTFDQHTAVQNYLLHALDILAPQNGYQPPADKVSPPATVLINWKERISDLRPISEGVGSSIPLVEFVVNGAVPTTTSIWDPMITAPLLSSSASPLPELETPLRRTAWLPLQCSSIPPFYTTPLLADTHSQEMVRIAVNRVAAGVLAQMVSLPDVVHDASQRHSVSVFLDCVLGHYVVKPDGDSSVFVPAGAGAASWMTSRVAKLRSLGVLHSPKQETHNSNCTNDATVLKLRFTDPSLGPDPVTFYMSSSGTGGPLLCEVEEAVMQSTVVARPSRRYDVQLGALHESRTRPLDDADDDFRAVAPFLRAIAERFVSSQDPEVLSLELRQRKASVPFVTLLDATLVTEMSTYVSSVSTRSGKGKPDLHVLLQQKVTTELWSTEETTSPDSPQQQHQQPRCMESSFPTRTTVSLKMVPTEAEQYDPFTSAKWGLTLRSLFNALEGLDGSPRPVRSLLSIPLAQQIPPPVCPDTSSMPGDGSNRGCSPPPFRAGHVNTLLLSPGGTHISSASELSSKEFRVRIDAKEAVHKTGLDPFLLHPTLTSILGSVGFTRAKSRLRPVAGGSTTSNSSPQTPTPPARGSQLCLVEFGKVTTRSAGVLREMLKERVSLQDLTTENGHKFNASDIRFVSTPEVSRFMTNWFEDGALPSSTHHHLQSPSVEDPTTTSSSTTCLLQVLVFLPNGSDLLAVRALVSKDLAEEAPIDEAPIDEGNVLKGHLEVKEILDIYSSSAVLYAMVPVPDRHDFVPPVEIDLAVRVLTRLGGTSSRPASDTLGEKEAAKKGSRLKKQPQDTSSHHGITVDAVQTALNLAKDADIVLHPGGAAVPPLRPRLLCAEFGSYTVSAYGNTTTTANTDAAEGHRFHIECDLADLPSVEKDFLKRLWEEQPDPVLSTQGNVSSSPSSITAAATHRYPLGWPVDRPQPLLSVFNQLWIGSNIGQHYRMVKKDMWSYILQFNALGVFTPADMVPTIEPSQTSPTESARESVSPPWYRRASFKGLERMCSFLPPFLQDFMFSPAALTPGALALPNLFRRFDDKFNAVVIELPFDVQSPTPQHTAQGCVAQVMPYDPLVVDSLMVAQSARSHLGRLLLSEDRTLMMMPMLQVIHQEPATVAPLFPVDRCLASHTGAPLGGWYRRSPQSVGSANLVWEWANEEGSLPPATGTTPQVAAAAAPGCGAPLLYNHQLAGFAPRRRTPGSLLGHPSAPPLVLLNVLRRRFRFLGG